jgi:hypothetical protein
MNDEEFGVRFPAGDFFPLHAVQSGSEAHLASYPKGKRASSPEVKRKRREIDNFPPPIFKMKNAWSKNSTPVYVFMA